MENIKVEVWKIFVPVLVWIVFIETYRYSIRLYFGAPQLSGPVSVFLIRIIPLILWLVFSCGFNMKLRSLKIKESLNFMGFGPISLKPFLVGLFSSLPLWSLMLGIASFFKTHIVWTDHFLIVLLWLMTGPGISEEAVFRGFVFRNLLEGRSFIWAATLSGFLWGFAHIHFFFEGGLTKASVVSYFLTFIFVLGFAYPAAFLFKRSGYVLWGYGFAHFAYDSCYVLVKNWDSTLKIPPGLISSYIWLGALIFASSIFILTFLFFPNSNPNQTISGEK